MRTEAEIRQEIEKYKEAQSGETGVPMVIYGAVINVLNWVLGEDEPNANDNTQN